MTLEEKIFTINQPAIADIPGVGHLPTGYADTIEYFFETFVKPRLPKADVIKQWHERLMEYTDESNWHNLSCCVRFGNNGSKKASSKGEKGYYKLRRGWLTKNNDDDFEYFFADNFFSSFIYKMALDGFVPSSVDELRESFQRHKFPYGFGFFIDNKINEYKGVAIAVGREPGFLGNYKLSHVFDAGESFSINGSVYGDAKLSEIYYPIGHSDDFLNNSNRIRIMPITYEAKRVIVAKFLRFAHPFNYFLTPTKQHHICGQKVYKKDIGEDPRVISYVKQYLEKEYPNEYKEFLSRIMWYDAPQAVVATGKERIDITYGLDVISTNRKKVMKAPPSPKNLIDINNINKSYLQTFQVGEIAYQVLRIIFKSGKITKSEVDKWKTKTATKAAFGFSKPLLSPAKKDDKGYNRYYSDALELYGETLYLYSQWLESHKERLVKWIVDWMAIHGGTI